MKGSSQESIRRILVIGLGVSGRAVCELLRRQGVDVVATDLQSRDKNPGLVRRLEALGCVLRLGEHRLEDFLSVDQIVVSPGVPLDIEPLRAARVAGVEVIGELEWAWRQIHTPVVAVSGTNGKSTTTSIIGDVLTGIGKNVFVGGNIGTPLSQWLLLRAQAVEEGRNPSLDPEWMVLEVSSFQLDTAPSFAPHVAVLLNISEDHLDRYAGFADYVESKARIFSNQTNSDVAILNLDDYRCRQLISRVPGRVLTFSRSSCSANACLKEGKIALNMGKHQNALIDLKDCPLCGSHNEENLLAAVLALTVLGIDPQTIEVGLGHIRPLPHRIEWIGRHRGIDFFNDSKATNVDAVIRALENFDRPVVLLIGGRDKGGSFKQLQKAVEAKAKAFVAFGEAGGRIARVLGYVAPGFQAPDLGKAFDKAVEIARRGDVILLSPACSSFDQYGSYSERGEHFRRLFKELSGQPGSLVSTCVGRKTHTGGPNMESIRPMARNRR